MNANVRKLISAIAAAGEGAERGQQGLSVEELSQRTQLSVEELMDAADEATEFIDPANSRQPVGGWTHIGLNSRGRQAAFEQGSALPSPRRDANVVLASLRINGLTARDGVIVSDEIPLGDAGAWSLSRLADALDVLEDEGFVTLDHVMGGRVLVRVAPRGRSTDRIVDQAPEVPGVLRFGTTLVGRQGSYRVERSIGQGGTANVYEVTESGGQRFAAKVLSPHRFELDVVALRRFAREIEVQRGLRHPGLLHVHDVAEHEGVAVPVMELLSGGSLHQRLRNPPGEGFPTAIVLAWMIRLVDALEHLHAQGMVHRDITPKNILFRNDEEPVLADFGTARNLTDETMTVEGARLGSPIYISAQQLRDPHGAKAADDIYSLGQVFYFLVGGIEPFGNVPALPTLIEDLSQDASSVTRIGGDGWPIVIATVVEQMRSFRAENRPPLSAIAAVLAEQQSGIGDLRPPWTKAYVEALKVGTLELRRLMSDAVRRGSAGDVEGAAFDAAGLYNAVRIAHGRVRRQMQGFSSSHENRLPARESTVARYVFPTIPEFYLEPVLADDEDGDAALNAFGFRRDAALVFHEVDRYARAREVESLHTPAVLADAMIALARKVRELEASEPAVVAAMASRLRAAN